MPPSTSRSSSFLAGAMLVALAALAAGVLLEQWAPSRGAGPRRAAAPSPEQLPLQPIHVTVPAQRRVERLPAAAGLQERADPPGQGRPSPRARWASAPADYGILGRVRLVPELELDFSATTVWASDAWGVEQSRRCYADGSFEIWGLGPGRWQVAAWVPDLGAVETACELWPGGSVASVELALEVPCSIEVHLSAEATVADACDRDLDVLSLQAHRADPRLSGIAGDPREVLGAQVVRPHWLLRRDRRSVAEPHRVRLDTRAPDVGFLGLYENGCLVSVREIAPGQQRIDWYLGLDEWPAARSSLRLRMISAESRQPLDSWVRTRFALDQSRTPDGGVLLRALAPGTHTLELCAPDHERLCLSVFLLPGEELDLGDIELQAAVAIEGVVLDPDGGPVLVDLVAWRWEPDGGAVDASSRRLFRSDQHGRFHLTDLRPGTYVLRSVAFEEVSWEPALARSWVSPFVVVHAEEDVQGVVLRLGEPGELVLEPASRPGAGLGFSVEDQHGLRVRAGTLWSSAPRRFSLAPGLYTVELEERDGHLGRWTVRVGERPVRVGF